VRIFESIPPINKPIGTMTQRVDELKAHAQNPMSVVSPNPRTVSLDQKAIACA
jgi:hypothetical protein